MRAPQWILVVVGFVSNGLVLSDQLYAQPTSPPPAPQYIPDASAAARSRAVPDGLRPETLAGSLPKPSASPRLGLPSGLETPGSVLIPKLGYGPAHCFPLTPTTCFDAAYKCYTLGWYADALAFADEGLTMSNNARLYLLKAVCEMHLGHCDDAVNAMANYRLAEIIPAEGVGLYAAQERINNPMRLRLEALVNPKQ